MPPLYRQVEEPCLHRQKCLSGVLYYRVSDDYRCNNRLGDGGKLNHGLALEQLPRSYLPPGEPYTLHKQQAQDRITAELEEVIVAPNAFDAQNILPDPREHRFDVALRRFPNPFRLRRQGERPTIHLAVR